MAWDERPFLKIFPRYFNRNSSCRSYLTEQPFCFWTLWIMDRLTERKAAAVWNSSECQMRNISRFTYKPASYHDSVTIVPYLDSYMYYYSLFFIFKTLGKHWVKIIHKWYAVKELDRPFEIKILFCSIF